VRRLLLVNALIFAVLAAAVALAYYGYRAASEALQREQVEQLMQKVAEEKVLAIESLVVNDDNKLFRAPLPLDTFLDKLRENANGLHINSVFVLDDELKIIPSGYVTSAQRSDKAAITFRDWFLKAVLPDLPLAKQKLGERGHLHAIWYPPRLEPTDPAPGVGKDYLFSFMKRLFGDKTYYIVIEEDTSYLVGLQFPQYFPRIDPDRSSLVYQVVDANGDLVSGMAFVPADASLSVKVPFVETVDLWSVRVSEKDESAFKEQQRKRVIGSVFIGGAVIVMLAGLLVLVLAIRRERRANELKSEFISNVSHELKTPLSIISMFGEMLANGRTKGPEQATEYADIIWRESVRLSRLIDNVLDFAKIERIGTNVYEFTPMDVGEVVERAIDLVGRRLATAEMSIDVEIEPELPHVDLDANAFTLAVMNLIDNATKYAADGKRIELKLQRRGDRIVLSVRDFGPGIDADEHEQIFERFYRARAVRLKPIRGSGIGLALVRHIARAHGGDVSVESAPGQGSTFRLWLPVSE